nr:preprotein translocase subunit SecE [Acetobacter sacchari]
MAKGAANAARQGPNSLDEGSFVSVSPVNFLRDVEAEAKRVTWPSRRATLVTTGAVLAMASLTSIFFFVVDQLIGLGVRELFGLGG